MLHRRVDETKRQNVNGNLTRAIDLLFNLPSLKRHCPSLLNNLFLAPLIWNPPFSPRRCVTTSDDNFLGRTSSPRSSDDASTYVGSWRGPRKGASKRAATIAFPERELSSPRNIVADIVFDAKQCEAASRVVRW